MEENDKRTEEQPSLFLVPEVLPEQELLEIVDDDENIGMYVHHLFGKYVPVNVSERVEGIALEKNIPQKNGNVVNVTSRTRKEYRDESGAKKEMLLQPVIADIETIFAIFAICRHQITDAYSESEKRISISFTDYQLAQWIFGRKPGGRDYNRTRKRIEYAKNFQIDVTVEQKSGKVAIFTFIPFRPKAEYGDDIEWDDDEVGEIKEEDNYDAETLDIKGRPRRVYHMEVSRDFMDLCMQNNKGSILFSISKFFRCKRRPMAQMFFLFMEHQKNRDAFYLSEIVDIIGIHKKYPFLSQQKREIEKILSVYIEATGEKWRLERVLNRAGKTIDYKLLRVRVIL